MIVEFLIKHISVTAERVEHEMLVETTRMKQIANIGDWIVTYNDGKKIIVNDIEFRKKYMPIGQNKE